MNTDRQMIEGLLSALEYHQEQTRPIHFTTTAIQAAREHLRARLAQPEPEPVAWAIAYDGETPICLYHDRLDAEDERRRVGGTATVLDVYTTPPPRRWVDLTNDEVIAIRKSPRPVVLTAWSDTLAFARAISAALKDKNT